MQWLKHAFAVEQPGSCDPTAEQERIIDRVCQEVVRRRLTTVALLYLEVARPLNYIGSQAMHFFRPIVSALFNTGGYEKFAAFLEHRGSVDHLCRRIEHFEAEHDRRRRADRASNDAPGPDSPDDPNPKTDQPNEA